MAFEDVARRIDDRELGRTKGLLKIVLSMVFCVLGVSNLESGYHTIPFGIVAAWLLLAGTFAVIRPRVDARSRTSMTAR